MWALVLASCGDDATAVDAAVSGDDAALDGQLASCGNGAVDPGEACDGTTIACDTLGGTWSGGQATCRASCTGWNVAACTRVNANQYETVKPATRDPRWTMARCNDGTPFAFDVRLATQPTQTWVIYLQGGVYCDDVSFSCAQRQVALTTTRPEADQQLSPRAYAGVFSRAAAADPNLAVANHVHAQYCSSDFWAGATTALRPSSATNQGWYYSGHTNVDAMLAILAERYGLDDSDPATQVLFGGGSAGAFGAHFNAAVAIAHLSMARARGDLRMFIDAGWMTDWDDPNFRIGGATVADREVWRLARAFWGATFDPVCEAAVAEPSTCLFGPTWYPHVSARVPTFISQSSIDNSFAGVHGLTGGAALSTWRTQVEASLVPVVWLHSGDTAYHVLGTSEPGMTMGPTGNTLREVLGRFWLDGTPQRVEF